MLKFEFCVDVLRLVFLCWITWLKENLNLDVGHCIEACLIVGRALRSTPEAFSKDVEL